MDYLTKLSYLLLQNGFANAITNRQNAPLLSFTKEMGPVWHVILIVDLDRLPFDDFAQVSTKYTQFYSSIPLSKKPNNIFITNLLISSKKEDPQLTHFFETIPPFTREFVSNVYWKIDPATGEVTHNPHSPSKMLNLRTLIQRATDEKIKRTYILRPIAKSHLTFALIITNLLIYMMVLSQGPLNIDSLLQFGAISPERILEHGEYYRLLTAMFLHGNFTHLFFNMFSLYVFGSRVERYYGTTAFGIIYVVSGLVASVSSLLFSQSVSVGSSGAIFGLFSACFLITFLFKRSVDGLSYQAIFPMLLINLGIGFVIPQIDNFGHLGGLVAGLILGYFFCRRLKNNDVSTR